MESKPQGIITRFNSPDEYLEELKSHMYRRFLTPRSERPGDFANGNVTCVRLTNMFTPSPLAPNIRLVNVVATHVVAGQIVRLDCFCGDDWGENFEPTKKTHERAEAVHKKIREVCADLHIEVRAGIFEHGA